MTEAKRKWYAVHTYAGYEDAVERYLKQRIDSLMMGDKIFSVIVPKEIKIKVRGGKRYSAEEKIYPGYVLVEMILDHDAWSVVRNTPRVTGFIGADPAHPTPLSKQEIESLLVKMGEKEPKFRVDLKRDEVVKVIDGPFKDQEGKVQEIDETQGKVKVMIPVFGRETLVELDSLQVEKV